VFNAVCGPIVALDWSRPFWHSPTTRCHARRCHARRRVRPPWPRAGLRLVTAAHVDTQFSRRHGGPAAAQPENVGSERKRPVRAETSTARRQPAHVDEPVLSSLPA